MVDLGFLGEIDRDDEASAAQQIAGILRAAILTGKIASGERLPSQPEMAAHYGVARETVKRALDALRAERLIVTRQGSGAFVRANTQRPVDLRPHVEAAFEQRAVSIDFAGFSGETLRDVLAEPLDKVRAGKLRPATIAVRILLPDLTIPTAVPALADAQDDPAVRNRADRILRRATGGIIDQVHELADLGLVQAATASVRVHSAPPMFKLYVLNNLEVFFGYYTVVRRSVAIERRQTPILDLMGKDTTLFHYVIDDADDSHGTQFVRASRQWFDSVWTTIAREYEPT